MNSSKSITTMYQILEKELGNIEAREGVTNMLFNVIGRLQDYGQQITEENLSRELSRYVNDYIEVSNCDVA